MLSPFKTSRAESDSARLGICVRVQLYMLCCCKMTVGTAICCTGLSPCCRLFCYVFAHEFLFNPAQFDLEPDYIIRKGIWPRIQRCNLRREILSSFHTRVDHHRSVRHFCIVFVFTPKLPFPFDDRHQNLIHPYRARPLSPHQTASGSNHPCRHCSHLRTDRWHKRKFYHISAPLYGERRANNIQCWFALSIVNITDLWG